MPFDPVDPRQSFPDLETGILKYWREEDTFKRSMERRKDGEQFSFYDGPPFATGLPHYGHILAGTIKDVIPRYQTMRGKFVARRFGWDCHGLPIENLIEKEKNLKSKRDIEELGVGKFNDLCRGAVQRYTKEWKEVVERMGRWVDMDHDYRTMDPEYMESIWWVFKELHKQGLIYEGHKPMHICPRCATPLSNFEVAQGYRDRTDQSVIMTFPLVEDPDTVLLAWTTTPWSLPGNIWLALGPDISYVKVKEKGSKTTYVLAEKLVESVFKGKEFEVVGKIAAKKLAGKKYVPLFPYFIDKVIPSTVESGKPQTYGERVFEVLLEETVAENEGTGIVHMTNSHGEDGFNIAKKLGVDILHHVTVDGYFIPEVTDFKGMQVKPEGDDPMKTDKAIIEKLKKMGRHFKSYTINHSYPHCWRCDTPLLNYAASSWFVAVEKIKPKMLAANAKTAWVPSHLRDGRFGKWLEGARDWAISRNRFWGTPLPIWRNSVTGDIEVIGSRDELMAMKPERFTKIVVMRHAESEGNVEKIYQGKLPGTELTETGKKQAAALGSDVEGLVKRSGIPLSAIYCSPFTRTHETAKAVAAATGAPLIVDERLREIEFGDYEGKHINFDDLTFIRERRAHKMETGQIESVYHFQGMETWSSVELRVGEFLDDVLQKHKGETIGVVTHADIVMNFTHAFTGMDPQKIVHQPYPGLAGRKVFYWDHERKAQMDLHKETVDEIMWSNEKLKVKSEKQTVELTLVRHGETDLNKKNLVQGSDIDMPLNKVGKEQAKAAGEGLKGQKFDVVLSSGMKRAEETAKIICKEIGAEYGGSIESFRERLQGDWNGKPVEEVMAEYGPKKTMEGLSPNWLNVTPPGGGESLTTFTNRVRRGHDTLLRDYAGKRVLMVAHGGVVRAMRYITGTSYEDVVKESTKNGHAYEFSLTPQFRRIEEVLDCWFESGSMPYAQNHFPFEGGDVPVGFPADFIAEGLDQTRGWFYTLMVLSSSLFDCPSFRNCIVNGIVLAEDGKKMSKKLKNYPEPTEVAKRHGADAVRFALMSSPAVRGEDLRFSEKIVEEVVRVVQLPLWNAYRLFVTYANAADWKPSLDFSLKNSQSKHTLDRWVILKTQDLVNKMTKELDGYDLSATCAHLAASIDDLTNWYVRLSRRRFAGKEEGSTSARPPEADGSTADKQKDALDTLYRVLLVNCQLLAPFCPFVTEDIYLNLVGEDHDSIHFTDWPQSAELTDEDRKLVSLMDSTRSVVTLGLSLRSDAKIKVRQPLTSVTFALPPSDTAGVVKELIAEELNVKQVIEAVNATDLASAIVMVDARKVGPKVGGKVQELIKAGKAGDFTEKDGKIVIMGVELEPDEAKIVYQSKEGKTVAAAHGIVVSLDTNLTDALTAEGQARELIHGIQQLRKDAGLEFTDVIDLHIADADALIETFRELIAEETRAEFSSIKGDSTPVDIGEGKMVRVVFAKKK